MIAYKFFFCDSGGNFHLLGILPERRESPRRITQESVMHWGRTIMGEASGVNQLYFIQVDM